MASNDAITIRSGDFRYRVTFQVRAEVGQDSTGGTIFDWVDDFSLWAAFEPMKSELLHTDIGDKRFAMSLVLFRVRYQPSSTRFIDPTRHRLVFNENPKIKPVTQTIWDIFPPEQKDSRYREWHIKARRYQ